MTKMTGKEARAKPFTLGGPALIFSIADEDLAAFGPALRTALEAEGTPIEIVPASSLANPHTDSDYYLGKYRPSEPGCIRLFMTGALELYEQAPDGRIIRGGKQVWPEAPVATGRPTAYAEGPLAPGEDAALCFRTGPRLRVSVTGPVLTLWHQPVLLEGTAPDGWLDIARKAIVPDPRPA